MATSERAQELANALLGLEATRAPLPVEKRRFGFGMETIKTYVQKNRTMVMVGAAVVVAVVAYAGYSAYQKKKQTSA